MEKNNLRKLLEETNLGIPHKKVPDLDGKVVLVIGASHPSGFGYNFGKIAAEEGNARVILTVSKPSRVRNLSKYASRFNSTISIFNVTDSSSYQLLEEQIREEYGRLDVIVVTPAYLNKKYFTLDFSWKEVPEKDKRECLKITVYPIRDLTYTFQNILAKSQGVVYGVSFPIKNLPGYTIGPAKEKLERLVVEKLAPEMKGKYIRVNIFSLAPFDSISSSVIPSYDLIRDLQQRFNCRNISLGEMVREAVSTIICNKTGHIYYFDGGLHQALISPENQKIINLIYEEYIQKKLNLQKL